MPGTVYKGRSSEPSAVWREGRLFENDGVGVLLQSRGAEWFAGRSSTPAFRVRGGVVYRGPSSEPFCRIQAGAVYKGNTSEVMYRVKGDALTRGTGVDIAVRGEGLTAEELLLTALILGV